MSDALESLNGLIVPLTEQGLLLPNVAVAELVSFRITRDVPGAPDWFLGWTRWREQQVPLVDPYRLLGQTPDNSGRQPRTLIMNAIGGREGVHFIGMRVWSIPRSRKVLRGEINEVDGSELGEPAPYISQSVQLADEAECLIIPDLEAIELALEQAGLLRG
ncbi:chemotaxis protein CheW [Halopseudomonas pelagia]|uniref:chemotaxis protein CheW n=1 Tax=Halopseudomonas pelagia TaxID=553151 RepID=UPI00039BB7D0|nr:chemotaxis protein CheW [Halopseudomonas pelagia]|tara:strand:+ start:1482 stop:1964 length:483 start_codon:yes stop_codon:yes gene_type:complete